LVNIGDDGTKFCVHSWALRGVATVAIGNPERQVRKASHCGSKQQ